MYRECHLYELFYDRSGYYERSQKLNNIVELVR